MQQPEKSIEQKLEQALLEAQAERVDGDPATVLGLHLELFAWTFLPEDSILSGAPVDPENWQGIPTNPIGSMQPHCRSR